MSAWSQVLSDPKHFFRSYATEELARLMSLRPNLPGQPGARDMAIYKRYFDLIASGEKTIEVRVGYSSMRRIRPDQLIRFTCRDEECLTRVKRVANYASFEAMFEALGVIAIEVERV